MKELLQHLEATLGTMECGWNDSDGVPWPFHILKFRGGPISDVVTYSTYGLSNTPLKSRVSGRMIQQELIIMSRPRYGDMSLPYLLYEVAMEAQSKSTAYLRGEVIGPRGPLLKGSKMEALYVSIPVYLPEDFAAFRGAEGHSCVFSWLVPISRAEAAAVRENGWESFEDMLTTKDPDLIDWYRL
jgi:hypothetical protein